KPKMDNCVRSITDGSSNNGKFGDGTILAFSGLAAKIYPERFSRGCGGRTYRGNYPYSTGDGLCYDCRTAPCVRTVCRPVPGADLRLSGYFPADRRRAGGHGFACSGGRTGKLGDQRPGKLYPYGPVPVLYGGTFPIVPRTPADGFFGEFHVEARDQRIYVRSCPDHYF